MKSRKDTKPLFNQISDCIRKYGLPPSCEDLARWMNVSVKRLYYYGNIRNICARAGFVYDGLPSHASQFEVSVYKLLREFLNTSDILYQHKFNDCRRINALPFDFYIPSINLVVEADGTQHYREGKPEWNYKKSDTDVIKNDYCKRNNIGLLRIRYRRYKWNSKSIRDTLASIMLHAQETGRANCFNCWDGDEYLPISNQAVEDVKRDDTITITKHDDYAEYSRTGNKCNLTVVMDIEDVEKLGTYRLYEKQGTIYHSKNGLSAARLFLGTTNNRKQYITYVNGDRYDLRKRNLKLMENSDVPRTRRLTKRSSTGIKGIHKSKGLVKGVFYKSIVASSHKCRCKKSFSYIRYGGENGAIQAAVRWLSSTDGSTTIPEGSTRKRVEMGSTQTDNAVGDDIVFSAGKS